jgi:hypothetical protein
LDVESDLDRDTLAMLPDASIDAVMDDDAETSFVHVKEAECDAELDASYVQESFEEVGDCERVGVKDIEPVRVSVWDKDLVLVGSSEKDAVGVAVAVSLFEKDSDFVTDSVTSSEAVWDHVTEALTDASGVREAVFVGDSVIEFVRISVDEGEILNEGDRVMVGVNV